MSEFSTTFPEGELAREIALRGLSQQEFAAKAGLDPTTILKGIRGQRLSLKSWGKIRIALGGLPAPELPADLVEQSA
ncbi:MAG TPA: helix-turn-helix transcriptional regulator [Candidatus Dormibacteraeota bacterium]|nr:helix-turn-helix transcriptional regulator [Candidatus Dormibacteraeota bacterium]